MELLAPSLLKFAQIVWINIILSGDNAVVIAMACGLPPTKQRAGMFFGALVAVALRVVFTVLIASLLTTPFLKIVGGALLLWIAVKLVVGEEAEESSVKETDRLWQAIRTVAIADAVMSLDNVLAIAAVAKDSTVLLVLGLAISIPLIIAGAALIMALLARFQILVWAGAGLLGWVAGEMVVSDPWLAGWIDPAVIDRLEMPVAAVSAAVVLGLGFVLSRRAASQHAYREAAVADAAAPHRH